MGPKKVNMLCHKLAVLADLMIQTIDELEIISDVTEDFRGKIKEMLPFCEQMQGDIYQLEQIKSSTYLTDISNKVDTVIRKSYELIKK